MTRTKTKIREVFVDISKKQNITVSSVYIIDTSNGNAVVCQPLCEYCSTKSVEGLPPVG